VCRSPGRKRPFRRRFLEATTPSPRRAYIAAAGIAADKKAFLFRTSGGHGGTALADQPMTQVDAWRMVRKLARAASIMAPMGNHSFRATGITAYLANRRCSGAHAIDGGAREPAHR
jgi:hypothetical protein